MKIVEKELKKVRDEKKTFESKKSNQNWEMKKKYKIRNSVVGDK